MDNIITELESIIAKARDYDRLVKRCDWLSKDEHKLNRDINKLKDQISDLNKIIRKYESVYWKAYLCWECLWQWWWETSPYWDWELCDICLWSGVLFEEEYQKYMNLKGSSIVKDEQQPF